MSNHLGRSNELVKLRRVSLDSSNLFRLGFELAVAVEEVAVMSGSVTCFTVGQNSAFVQVVASEEAFAIRKTSVTLTIQ